MTYLLAGDACPHTDNVPDHTLRIPPDAAEDVEEHGKPALCLPTQELDVVFSVLSRYHVGAHGLGELIELPCSDCDVGLH